MQTKYSLLQRISISSLSGNNPHSAIYISMPSNDREPRPFSVRELPILLVHFSRKSGTDRVTPQQVLQKHDVKSTAGAQHPRECSWLPLAALAEVYMKALPSLISILFVIHGDLCFSFQALAFRLCRFGCFCSGHKEGSFTST
eukprot:m.349174 g.349174  ORF g.349174 m.349174 type:complete len:143 (-) comp20686_c0_seq3:369-797(-)